MNSTVEGTRHKRRMPLHGIKVVDLTSAVVGPYATQILADYGAEVIKVEERSGDIIRWISGRSPKPGMSGKFVHMNRNKRSVSLNLKAEGGKEALKRIVQGADVFVHNMRAKAIERLGLTFEQISKVNDRIVYCEIVGFGKNGRYANRPAYDSILQGGTGLASLLAVQGGEPRYVPYVVVDRTAGIMVSSAILAALYSREKEAGPIEVSVPMFESYVSLLLSEHMYGRTFEPNYGPTGDQRLLDANARPVKTKDGYICITTNTDAQVLALFDAFQRADLKQDNRFNKAANRIEHISQFFAIRAAEIAKQTTSYWMEALSRADVPAMPCHTIESLLADEHLGDVGLLERVVHPTLGSVWNIKPPVSISGLDPSLRSHAPHIGQHTREVLQESGYAADEIESMLASASVFADDTPR
jgi:crotonobetainyl-CoA:carnitine CoA-transferase CaiB-like acyl-CoA transferase